MKLALKTHLVALVALMQTVLALIGSAFGTFLLALPGLAGEAPLALLVALLATLLVAPAIVRAWPSTRTNASRNPGLVTVMVVLLQVTPAVLVAGLGALLGGTNGLAYLGILLWLLSIQLTVAVLVSSPYQGVAPAVYVLLCALIGRVESVVQPWAWPLAEIGSPLIALIGAVAFTASIALLATLGLRDRRGR